MKLTVEDKIEIYNLRKIGVSLVDLSLQFNINKSGIKYLVSLIDIHGYDILSKKYRIHSNSFKTEAINRVLLGGESLRSVALHCGLSSAGMLHNWIRIYKENGYNVLNKKRGRPPMVKPVKENEIEQNDESQVRKLERENEYLRAENDFLKKWNAVVRQKEKHKKKR